MCKCADMQMKCANVRMCEFANEISRIEIPQTRNSKKNRILICEISVIKNEIRDKIKSVKNQ